MTHDSVTNFAASLVEMAKSHEEAPKLHNRIEELEISLEDERKAVQRLELRIIDLKADQDALYSKLREVEKERDDASFRLLESEDRVAVVKHLLGGAQAALVDAVKAVTPEPEPVKEAPPIPLPDMTIVPSESSSSQQGVPAFTGSIELRAESGEPLTLKDTTVTITHIEPPAGQSEPLPTVESGIAESAATTRPASLSGDAGLSTPGSTATIADDEAIHGPYWNKRYIEVKGWISRQDWLDGGGTEADYDWRPEIDSQFGRASHYS